MALDITIHRVSRVALSKTKIYSTEGKVFWSRDITVTFMDGTSQDVSLFSDVSAEALAVESENSATVAA